ncbi:hypothetical protein Ocin01_19115 [Orchesella cincta]|uniref:Uncharacterized protein n=1 Tax=Orchesella cincta TaxID=48709 RepID=A0A1D2M3L5_ORCCI|nr:hypothetical protein Ocin01_19115 [Orchesella cincta]
MCGKIKPDTHRALYCRKLDLEQFSVDVVVNLLKTAHKYNIGQLEKFTTQFLSRQTTDWFTVNGALELYLFTMNVDNLHTLSGKLRTIMRANPQQLSSCFTFLSWMHKNPKAAAEFALMLLEPEPMNPLDSPNSSPRSPPYSPCTIYSFNFDPDSD